MDRSAVKFSTLEELKLGISQDEIRRAIAPFIATGTEFGLDRWKAETALRRKRLVKRLRKRLLKGWFGKTRDAGKVRIEYDAVWSAGHGRYEAGRQSAKFAPWVWRGDPLLFDAAGAARFRCLLLAAAIDAVKPNRVLEVGCGDGINLLLLSGLFPDISFTGIELTGSGHRAALRTREAMELPANLIAYSPLPQKDPLAFKRIEFIEGDACAMPFASGAFDLVMTVLSIEQMERVRSAALADIARVTRSYLLDYEPFREVNNSGLRSLNVLSRDYFRGSISDLPRYGLTPLWATADFPQEAYLGAALVLSRKQ